MAKTTITNPVLRGFYSDPSVCRVGEDFYLVTSSFEFFPGLPLFHSRDLANWQQLGHCLTHPGQLDLAQAGVSDGIFAPTLRWHRGRFYAITSNRCAGAGNHFYVYTDDINGAWSDPVWVTNPDGSHPDGVDPSLLFDEDGKVYFCCVAWDEKGQGVGQAEIDLDTGRLAAPLRIVWYGTGGTFPEGPHTYKINGWYYLLIAEGGTEYGHKVTVARSRDVFGPYEGCPHNPVLTQARQQAQAAAIQGVGHGDLLEDGQGNWWLVVHGFRPSVGKLHHLGRETLLVPVKWDENGWPVAGDGWLAKTTQVELPGGGGQMPLPDDEGRFDGGLPDCFATLRAPLEGRLSLTEKPGWLTLYGSPATLNGLGTPTWLGRRQQQFACEADTLLDFAPGEGEEAGLTVYQTPEHHYDLVVTKRDGMLLALLRRVVGDILWESPPVPLIPGLLRLSIAATAESYRFTLWQGGARHDFGPARTQLLSTEAMLYQNFTGTFFALFAVSPCARPRPAYFKNLGVRFTGSACGI